MSGKPSSTPVSSSTTTTQTLSPQQQQLLDIVMPIAKNYGTNPPQLYPGSTIAPTNALQTSAQEAALRTASGAATDLNKKSTSSIGSLMAGGASSPGAASATSYLTNPGILDPSSNPYLAASIQAAINPVSEAFTNTVLPNIRSGAVTAGQFGGSRQGVLEGTASNDFIRRIGDISSTMASNAYGQGLGALISGGQLGNQQTAMRNQAMTSGLALSPQIMQNLFAPSQVQGAVGDAQQAAEQAKLTEAAQRFMAEQLIPFSTAQDIAALAYGMPAGTTTTNAVGTQLTQKPGAGQAIATGLGAVASISAIF